MRNLGKYAALGVALGALWTAPALAAGGTAPVEAQQWSFHGVFGSFDRAEVQRGLQVYLAVCATCHSLDLVAYRNLAEIGYNEDQIKDIAAEYEITDGPNDDGEMFQRPGKPSDYFAPPYANLKAAAAMNGGKAPPDLSLITKARAGGADYIYALLTGYTDDTGEHEIPDGLSYNPYFPGGAIGMPPPLYGDDVAYADGTAATIEQEARDVSAFLTWAAEPELEARKQLGLKVILFMLVLTVLLYATKRKVWRNLH